MGTTPTEVMAFPNIRAIVRDNGTAEVVVAGNSRIVPAGDSVQELRNNALALIVGEAQTLQRPVRVRSRTPKATVNSSSTRTTRSNPSPMTPARPAAGQKPPKPHPRA